jgi:SnoaL-like domain
MHKLLLVISIALTISCNNNSFDAVNEKSKIDEVLNVWHNAAANAEFDNYFALMDNESVFIGTDATENWNKQEFMTWSKPYFDKGKAWSFTSLERNIYFNDSGNLAWFDELLNTQMKICRGSGVVEKKPEGWKIKQYVLSATIPNNIIDSVTEMKAAIEDSLIQVYKK